MNGDWMMFRWIHECSRACPSGSREKWGMVSKQGSPVEGEPASPHASTIKPLKPLASSERWSVEEEGEHTVLGKAASDAEGSRHRKERKT